jgi:hypothetical protein
MSPLAFSFARVRGLAVTATVVVGGVACQAGQTKPSGTEAPALPASPAAIAPPAAAAPQPDGRKFVTFEGTCDASGAIELDRDHMLVADDENDVLRVYDVERGGPPTLEVKPTWTLGADTESDLEASTLVGDRAYFLSSHGRTSKGKRDPERQLFFAASVPPVDGRLSLVGEPYRGLLDDLLQEPGLARFGLAEAALLAPKEPGGLNMEGLTAGPNGTLLLGFRSPLPENRALVVGITNPDEVIHGKSARFGEPQLLDLGGLGVRAFSRWRSVVLVLAGPTGEGGPFRLFRWDERGAPTKIDADLTGLGAEALFAHDARDEVLVLSDDGNREYGGKKCKKLKDPKQKRFRGLWVKVPH